MKVQQVIILAQPIPNLGEASVLADQNETLRGLENQKLSKNLGGKMMEKLKGKKLRREGEKAYKCRKEENGYLRR